MDFENIRIKFSGHAIRRMFERKIHKNEVVEALKTGEIIRKYPEDKPYPSSLILTFREHLPLHIVLAFNEKAREVYIITVYVPDKNIWSENYRTRIK